MAAAVVGALIGGFLAGVTVVFGVILERRLGEKAEHWKELVATVDGIGTLVVQLSSLARALDDAEDLRRRFRNSAARHIASDA